MGEANRWDRETHPERRNGRFCAGQSGWLVRICVTLPIARSASRQTALAGSSRAAARIRFLNAWIGANVMPRDASDRIGVTFGRTHKTLRVTPAMEAGITGHVLSLE
ncbi:MAG: hypothetical protein ABI583_05850 [Betaproteobacteria bacterium]